MLAAVGLLLALLAGWDGSGANGGQPRRLAASASEKAERAGQPASSLIDLQSVAQLRRLFNAKVGLPRLIILASPT